MFSGCAPYPCVLSKNTKAKSIVGIEINPEGHRYGLGNLELNRLRNVALICGDVKKEVPRINRHIIGLKSAIDGKELKSRLAENPLIMELHLFKKDLFGNKPALEKTILRLKKKKIQIILHMPFPEKEDCWLGGKKPENALKTLKVLGELCKKHGAAAVVHVTWGIPEIGEEEIANNVRKLREYYDYFYFENGIKGFGKTEQVLRIGGQAGIKNVCIDTAHLYIIYRDSEKIIDHIERMQQDFGTYFHLSDSDGTTEGGLFDSGFIDLKRIIPYVQKGIAEVRSRDEKNPLEMTGSFREVTSEQRKFDRILMPLPKSAGDFIGTALLAARKGTIIHFYSFLREDDFAGAERIVGAACRKAGRKWRKLALVKCGQHAPRTFRVCLDFEVLD
jgi:tRNA G37 N-methylase Trm5